MKILKWIMKAVVALVTIITLIVLFADDLEHTYNKLTWTPPAEINGIAIGMTRSDVVFTLGKTEACTEDKQYCQWDGRHLIHFIDERVDYQRLSKTANEAYEERTPDETRYYTMRFFRSMPFRDTQSMKSLIGDEGIYAESRDFNNRTYTYLKSGASFGFENDILSEYTIGSVTWRRARLVGGYVVKGSVVCPGTECPFDDEGGVKEAFKDRDYTYFIE